MHPLRSLLFVIGLSAFPALAHEFWLEPLTFQIEPDDPLKAHIKIGQYFKGNTYAYIPGRFERFELTLDGQTEPVDARLGTIPAVGQTAEHPGLALLTYESTYEYLTYDDPETFRNFLKLDGLAWVAQRHRERDLPASGFTEAYRRFAKAYIGVGNAEGEDKAVGFPFEWVLQHNPYALDAGQPLTARLLWQGQPFADSLVRVFVRQNGEVEEWRLETSASGQVSIPYRPNADYLVSSVHMIEATDATDPEQGAVWESLWASAVFHRP
ncbi:DUF4198 domain-containing protein [Saccharospirillum salsuginis]|uniref:Uncharacterized protein n=1 Tax=Saccharospirillum salsuginis TaxID=418750 RepID=A0A918KBB4_9GAMM|nr:DUF4198 domain-containing protein [Saccharospirillum salsuginis]GGX55212.1 hypothetical protein GCM10007392_23570 [Saccharospirillum salsuginis]